MKISILIFFSLQIFSIPLFSISKTDVNAHSDRLYSLCSECASVIELGAKPLAFTQTILDGLATNQKTQTSYLGIDIADPDKNLLKETKNRALEKDIHFTFWKVTECQIQIEPTDLLLINTLHSYAHLYYELNTFSPHVHKYICLYQTHSNWADKDETSAWYNDYVNFSYDKNKHGLTTAIKDFLYEHPEWEYYKDDSEHNGFTILKRVAKIESVPKIIDDPKISEILKNKIILCTGPSLDRADLLKATIESDLSLVNFKKIFISTQDPNIYTSQASFGSIQPYYDLFPNQGKQLDCLNSIITGLRNAVNDPDTKDDDIILFKHESVFINDMNLFKRAIQQLLSGYNMLVRSQPKISAPSCSDVFFVKAGAIKSLVANYPFVTELDCFNCEHYLDKHFVTKIKNCYKMHLNCNWWKFTQIGFYHHSSDYRLSTEWGPGCSWWDKKNYYTLYTDENLPPENETPNKSRAKNKKQKSDDSKGKTPEHLKVACVTQECIPKSDNFVIYF